MHLKPISYKKAYEDIIASKIIVWLWANVFHECFVILREQEVTNDGTVLREAIMSGSIQYNDGVFVARKKFSNKVALELEKIGAKFSRSRGGYVLAKDRLPIDLLWAVESMKARTAAKVFALKEYLTAQLGNVDKLINKLIFDNAVEAIMLDLQKRVYRNAEQHKIQLISPKIDDFMATEIAQNYTNNLHFWIKQWLPEDMTKMRSVVGQMAIEGKSVNAIAQYIEKQFGVSQRKAKFLARNETAIATTSYLKSKYMAEGITHFRWHTHLDGRERDWHKTLGTVGPDGKGNIYRFDDPPIINDKTGQKGLPGEDYNCRCSMSPIITEEFLQRRRAAYKAQNSLIDKIKAICLRRKTKID